MSPFRSLVAICAAACLGGLPIAAHGQLNVLCSVPAEWCKILADEFQKDTGTKVTLVSSGGRAALATLAEQKGRPQSDVWLGGAAEAHLRAGKFGLVDEYASPMVKELQPWAQKLAEQSKSQSFGLYARVLGIGYNSALATQKKLAPPACWKDLIRPGYAGDINISNPRRSGATYLAIASMVQIFGEDEAFKYMKAMYKAPPAAKSARGGTDAKTAIPKSAPGPGAGKGGAGQGGVGSGAAGDAAATRAPPPVGNAIAGIGFVGDIVAEAESGSPVKAVAPCEGTVYEVGALSIVKAARNLDNAKKFVDWALGAKAQALATRARQYVYPANAAVAAPPLAPMFGEIKFINYDVAKYAKSVARRDLVDRWMREVATAPP